MKKLLLLVLFGTLLGTACGGGGGGSEKTSDDYVREYAEAVCNKAFDCYPAEAALTYDTESKCITDVIKTIGNQGDCDDLNHSFSEKCITCYENTYTCADALNGTDSCVNTMECQHSCNDDL